MGCLSVMLEKVVVVFMIVAVVVLLDAYEVTLRSVWEILTLLEFVVESDFSPSDRLIFSELSNRVASTDKCSAIAKHSSINE